MMLQPYAFHNTGWIFLIKSAWDILLQIRFKIILLSWDKVILEESKVGGSSVTSKKLPNHP